MKWRILDLILVLIVLSPGIYLISIQGGFFQILGAFLAISWLMFISFLLGMSYKGFMHDKIVKGLEDSLKK